MQEVSKAASRAAKQVFIPSYHHALELFLDSVAKLSNDSYGRGAGINWECEKSQGKTYHWRQSIDSNGVTRVKFVPDKDLQRFIEIHWEGQYVLVHQFDPVENRVLHDCSKFSPKEYLQTKKELAAMEKHINESVTLHSDQKSIRLGDPSDWNPVTNYTSHVGYDIPQRWQIIFKKLAWPKCYVPDYLHKVDYFEPYRNIESMDKFREHAYSFGTEKQNLDVFYNKK